MVRPAIVVLKPWNKSRQTNRKGSRRTCRYRSKLARLLLWASLASTPAFSSYRLHEYHAVPCSDHGPMHTQQNSCLHFLHVIWLSDVHQQQRRIESRKKENQLAPPILLNRALTHRTLLRVALDPIRSLAIVPTFLQPHSSRRTHDRPMIALDSTTKAKLVFFPRQTEGPSTSVRLQRRRRLGGLSANPPRTTRDDRDNGRQAHLARGGRA